MGQVNGGGTVFLMNSNGSLVSPKGSHGHRPLPSENGNRLEVELTSTRLFSSSLPLLHSCGLGERVRCGRGIMGVNAGEGIGDGSSRMGERHLLIALFPLGISSRIDGGCK